MDVKEEAVLGPDIGDHWYYVSKGRALRSMLGRASFDEVLDVGAGSGVFTRQLLDAGTARRGVCVDPGYETDRRETHHGHEISFVRGVDEVTQSLILMMDVLEHVDDDLALLREYTDRMRAGGLVLITVPAFQFLWSGHDVFLEHRRRYKLRQVEKLVRQADLRLVRGRYYFGSLFPAVTAMRLVDRARLRGGKVEAKSQLKRASAIVNATLIGIHGVERAVVFPFNRLAGLSAFCLATKE